jgi:hypothetical protein
MALHWVVVRPMEELYSRLHRKGVICTATGHCLHVFSEMTDWADRFAIR